MWIYTANISYSGVRDKILLSQILLTRMHSLNVWAICLQAVAFTSAHSTLANFCRVSSYFCLSASLYISVHLYVAVNILSVQSKATLLAGVVCTNIGCGGGLRGSQREVARHGPTLVQAHTHTHKHTAAKAGSSKSYTPPGEARTHRGTGSQEEGAASVSLIKTVAVHLNLLLTLL